MKQYRLLMLTTLIISGCSICYELIISAVSSYLVGNSTLQYSITIGLYMCAMGLGSFLSKFIKKNLFDWFIFIEIGVGIVGGMSSLILFLANLYLESYSLVMYIEIIVIGTFVGCEIPVLTRIIESEHDNLRITLSSIFSFDYIGGLIGSIAFPLLLLPHLGYFSTSFLTGCFNLVAAILIILKYRKRIKHILVFRIISACVLILMIFGMIFSENISKYIENGLYRDDVVLIEQTKYQKIVMTKYKDDMRLFLDGNIQFCSKDEYRYHEALVHIPMSQCENVKEVLILGGGDGLAARELFKYPDLEVTLVDLDEEMVSLCAQNYDIKALNEGSLTNPRMHVVIDDAYQFLQKNEKEYDLIIVDLPDPNNDSLNKLYTNIFYRMCSNALSDDGVMVVQSISPYYATDAFWCIHDTLESEGFYVYPYHLQVPAFGDWGFHMVSKHELPLDFHFTVETKYLTDECASSCFQFAKDEVPDHQVSINTLSNPILITYYDEAVRNWE